MSYIVCHRPNSKAKKRLICFPYAGRGASVYQTWPDNIPRHIELWAIQIPGRENRMEEPMFSTISSLVQHMGHSLSTQMNIPFALFGHSLGGIIAFEFARYLATLGLGGMLTHLFVSAHRAPHIPLALAPISHLSNREFLEEIQRRYGGWSQEVLKNEETMAVLLPTLKKDFAMFETYIYTEQPPLSCPITVFGGTEDISVPLKDLQPWQKQTKSHFQIHTFPYGHFFLKEFEIPIVKIISDSLEHLK